MRDDIDIHNEEIERYNAQVENENQGRSKMRRDASWKAVLMIFIITVAGGTGSFFLDRWLREVFK